MPEPVSMTIAAVAVGAWIKERLDHYGCDKTMQEKMQEKGFTGTESPSTKFLQALPHTQKAFDLILTDPVFKQNEVMKDFLKTNLDFALTLQPGEIMKREYVDVTSASTSLDGYMVFLAVQVLPDEDAFHSLSDSPLTSETKDEVKSRILNELGDDYAELAASIHCLGIDGRFLATEGFTADDLRDDLKVTSKLKNKLLLNFFDKYKHGKVNRAMVGITASRIKYLHKDPTWFGLNHGITDMPYDELKQEVLGQLAYNNAGELAQLTDSPSQLMDSPIHPQVQALTDGSAACHVD